jgi:hypothetical protein
MSIPTFSSTNLVASGVQTLPSCNIMLEITYISWWKIFEGVHGYLSSNLNCST